MCLIVFSFKDKSPFFKQNNSSEKEFVLLANRDEFYDRPTLSMQWWGGKRNILSGQDKLGGGTWFGVTKKGRLKNYIKQPKTSTDKVVPWARFELTTPRLGGECSIQLSYQGMSTIIVSYDY